MGKEWIHFVIYTTNVYIIYVYTKLKLIQTSVIYTIYTQPIVISTDIVQISDL